MRCTHLRWKRCDGMAQKFEPITHLYPRRRPLHRGHRLTHLVNRKRWLQTRISLFITQAA